MIMIMIKKKNDDDRKGEGEKKNNKKSKPDSFLETLECFSYLIGPGLCTEERILFSASSGLMEPHQI